jgi:hypothetical protein
MLATTYIRHSLLTGAMMLALSACGQRTATQPPRMGIEGLPKP